MPTDSLNILFLLPIVPSTLPFLYSTLLPSLYFSFSLSLFLFSLLLLLLSHLLLSPLHLSLQLFIFKLSPSFLSHFFFPEQRYLRPPSFSLPPSLSLSLSRTHTHVHTHILSIYIYLCVCVCVCACARDVLNFKSFYSHKGSQQWMYIYVRKGDIHER